jgi:CBS domain-containing protein
MRAQDIMTENPACCRAETPLPEVARQMCENDCGMIPVVDERSRVIGVVTDRDIVCRTIAQGRDAAQMRAKDCWSGVPVTVHPDTSVDACCELLERNQIRRLVVVDDAGACLGIIAQADIARSTPQRQTGEVVRAVSKETKRTPNRPLPLARM